MGHVQLLALSEGRTIADLNSYLYLQVCFVQSFISVSRGQGLADDIFRTEPINMCQLLFGKESGYGQLQLSFPTMVYIA